MPAVQLLAEQTGQVKTAAAAPSRESAYLHLDVELLTLQITGQYVKNDVLAGQFAGVNVRVDDFEDFNRLFSNPHGIDEGRKQFGHPDEQRLEDKIVFGIK